MIQTTVAEKTFPWEKDFAGSTTASRVAEFTAGLDRWRISQGRES